MASEAPVSAKPDAQLRGATIGRYVVLGTLGAGGMGIVYAAYDPELDRRIELKLLRGRATNDTGHARIRREAQALARADHPNIVTAYDVGDHGDAVFIAMEIVDGGTLRTWQAQHGRDAASPPRTRAGWCIATSRCLFQSYQALFSYQNTNELIADASFALARALWDGGGDRTRARTLAALAIARYTSFETAPRAAAEAWLAAHR